MTGHAASALFLAWRYVLYNRLKTAILVVCIAVTMFLPLAVHLLVRGYDRQLLRRARSTPLVLGARGNRYDLVLQALYFRAGKLDAVHAGVAGEIDATGLGHAIPLHVRFTARSHPIVGTSLEYFELRRLECAAGRLPGILGEAVAGSRAAAELGLAPGDSVITDQQSIYDISRTVPVRLHVTGVLAPAGSPDDFAIFVDVKTAWIIEGLGHGHTDVTSKGAAPYVLRREKGNVVVNAALSTIVEITPENINSFHFHGDPSTFPLSAVIVVPRNDRGRTILATRYDASKEYQALDPVAVVLELMGIVFRVKAFFDANFAVVALSNVLFLALVVLLSLRIRRAERMTIHKMGGSRSIVFWMQSAELGIIAVASALLAALLALLLLWLSPSLFQLL